jgi:nitroreductase
LISGIFVNFKNSSPSQAVDLALEAIANRKNHSAKRLVGPGPTQSQINRIFEAAASAPDHGGETPWRFVLIHEDKRHLLGEAFANALHQRDNNALAEDLEKAKEKAFNSPLLALAICKQDKGSGWITNSERLISLGCAIQNILISATALGFGSGLTSGKAMTSSFVRDLFRLNENEACICFINIGTVSSASKVTRIRPSIGSFISSL